jgi:hypothetical protein
MGTALGRAAGFFATAFAVGGGALVRTGVTACNAVAVDVGAVAMLAGGLALGGALGGPLDAETGVAAIDEVGLGAAMGSARVTR